MFGSGILDTVIGVIFVFLLVSLIVTTANEFVAAIIRSRAKWLEYGIHRLIGAKWALALFQHPLIEGSTRGWKPAAHKAARGHAPASADGADATLRWRGAGPSYIPSRTFANVLMELLQGGDRLLAETERALHKALEAASAGADSASDIKLAVDGLAAALPARLPPAIRAAIVADLAQLAAMLDRNAAGQLADWLAELEGHTLAMSETALGEARTALAAVMAGARAGTLELPHIRQQLIASMHRLPPGAAGDMARARLSMLQARLEAGYGVADAIADVRRFIRAIPAGYVRELIVDLPEQDRRTRTALLTLYDDAANDVEKFKQNIEVWFNNAMDRVGGWYKRRAQLVTFGISAVVVVLMNVDAMLIVRYLDANAGVRDGLVTQAQAFVEAKAREPLQAPAARTGVVAGDSYSGRLQIKTPPTTTTEVVFSTDAPGAVFRPKSSALAPGATSVGYTLDTAISDEAMKASVTAKADGLDIEPATVEIQPSYVERLRRVQEQLMGLKLPIGWTRHPTHADSDMRLGLPRIGENVWNTVGYHLLGWLITAIAATLGAPFWFDMLNKIMSIRSSGKAPEEMPKAPQAVQVPTAPGQSPTEASRLAAFAKSGKA